MKNSKLTDRKWKYKVKPLAASSCLITKVPPPTYINIPTFDLYVIDSYPPFDVATFFLSFSSLSVCRHGNTSSPTQETIGIWWFWSHGQVSTKGVVVGCVGGGADLSWVWYLSNVFYKQLMSALFRIGNLYNRWGFNLWSVHTHTYTDINCKVLYVCVYEQQEGLSWVQMVGGESHPLIPEPGYYTPPSYTNTNTRTHTHSLTVTLPPPSARPHTEFVHFSLTWDYPRYIMSVSVQNCLVDTVYPAWSWSC